MLFYQTNEQKYVLLQVLEGRMS